MTRFHKIALTHSHKHEMDKHLPRRLDLLPFLVISLIVYHLAADSNDIRHLLILAYTSRQFFWAALPYIWMRPRISKEAISSFTATMVHPLYVGFIKFLEIRTDDDDEWRTILPSLRLVYHLQGLKLDFVRFPFLYHHV